MNEYLRRIDKREYLTEREHREYLKKLESDLEVLEIFKTQFCIKTQKAFFNKRPMFIINIMGHDIFIPRVIYDKLYKWLKRGGN